MPLLDWLFGSKRLKISHKHADNINLGSIDNDTDFTREGSGETLITGSVGHGVHLIVQDTSSLKIRGDIGSGCSIYKEGSGSLIIEGDVVDDLKLTVYGQGSVSFTRQPPESVIRAIKNRGGVARITCAGTVLPLPNHGYVHHNLARPANLLIPEQRERNHLQFVERPAPLPQPINVVEDKYSEITAEHINVYKARNHKSIAVRINELNLTPDEKPLFEKFTDPIMDDYIDDVPVMHNERYYNLSTLLRQYQINRKDPFTRHPLKLADIQPARSLLISLDESIKELEQKRAARNGEAQRVGVEEAVSSGQPKPDEGNEAQSGLRM